MHQGIILPQGSSYLKAHPKYWQRDINKWLFQEITVKIITVTQFPKHPPEMQTRRK